MTALESLIQDLPVGVLVSDRNGRILCFNEAAQRILGLNGLDVDPEDRPRVYGCYLRDTATPVPAGRMPLARALRGEVVQDDEIFVRNEHVPEGVWISASAAPSRGADGNVSGGVVVFRDITRQQRSLEHTRRLSSAVEQTADGVIITDMDGTIQYVNPGFETMTGYGREEVVGRTPRILKSGEHDSDFYERMWSIVLGGGVYRGTLLNRKKGGQLFHAEQTISPVRGSDGHHAFLVSVLKDITERLQNEHMQVEMAVARQVQQRLYPKSAPRVPGFDIAGAAFPATTLCGDLYDFFPMPGDCLGLAVADVCGHGLGPALLMAQARAYLRSLALSCFDVGELLRRLNEILVVDSDVKDYLTLLVARLDPLGRTLTYASAGHVTGYLLDSEGRVRERLASTGIPLGMFAGRGFRSGPTVSLKRGETVVLLTDGFTEIGELQGNAFGEERFLEFVREHRTETAASIVQGLYRAARSFEVGSPRPDDMTVIVCQVDRRPAPGENGVDL